ncbi:MAG: hypothetical protein ACRDY6_12750 [Acidimicrobiia bacterium]
MADDVTSLTDMELLERYRDAVDAIPDITEDRDARRRAWDEVQRYHDELARRYPPATATFS